MKKRIILLISVILILTSLSGCISSAKKSINKDPDILQIRNICNLATLDCYYHNVAKSIKKPEAGISHIGEKKRNFWIEYTGIARLGIDMSKVSMSIQGHDITITMPEATVLNISIDETTLNEDSYITSANGINNNKIDAKDQTDAIKTAQKNMEESVKSNSTLLLNAQNRAKTLIENYISQLGEITGIKYNITWEFITSNVDEDSNKNNAESENATPESEDSK